MIVYIGSFRFPLGDAVAKRVLGVGQVLHEMGHRVAYIGESAEIPVGEMSDERYYGNFLYCSIHESQSAVEHYTYRKDLKCVVRKLNEWNQKYGIEAVFFTGTKCALFAAGLLKACKKIGIPTVADSMDWLVTNTGNPIFDFVKWLDITYEMRCVNRKANGVMAISTYLEKFYKGKGMKTVVIPPISPHRSDDEEDKKVKNEVPVLIYAGIPCRMNKPLSNPSSAKDRIDLVIDMLYDAHREKCSFQFHIWGFKKQNYLTAYPMQKDVVEELVSAGKLVFGGYVPSSTVQKEIEQADFMILLREKNRTSMAGFPSKVSESITLGTPVITTDTSDLTTYLEEGNDSFFLDIDRMEEAKMKIKRLLNMSIEERSYIKNQTKRNQSFSPNSYVERMTHFINKISGEVYED